MRNRLKERLARGEPCVGTWITIGNPDVVALLRTLEFDCFVFDLEHTPLGWEAVSHLIPILDAGRTTPMVRLASNGEVAAKRALDMGAQGVIVPFVNSGEDALKAVRCCKYPPMGVRGVGPRAAADFGTSFAEYLRSANEQTLVFAIVESAEGVENLDGILGVGGLDGALLGYADLAMSYGLLDDYSGSQVIEAKRRLVEACKRHGKTPAIFAPSPDDAREAVGMGFRLVWLGSDTTYLRSGARSFLDSVRGDDCR